jgi:hypothetical protein
LSASTCHSQPTPRCSYSWSRREALSLCDPTSAIVSSWVNTQRATARTPNTATPRMNMIETRCSKGMLSRARSKAALSPAVKLAIQATTHGSTTTRPRAAMPRPAAIEATTTWEPGSSDGKKKRGSESQMAALKTISPTSSQSGSRWPERPTWVIACVRAICMARRLKGRRRQSTRPARTIGASTRGRRHHRRSDDIGRREEGREMGARKKLRVAQGRILGITFGRCDGERFATRQARRNHPLVSVRGFVHSRPACFA